MDTLCPGLKVTFDGHPATVVGPYLSDGQNGAVEQHRCIDNGHSHGLLWIIRYDDNGALHHGACQEAIKVVDG
jgi:hypothetical protein